MANPKPDASKKDQEHPQWQSDRQIMNTLLTGEPSDYNLSELARLKMRYNDFPGARDIQADLEKVLKQWQLTEDELYAKTRQIHQTTQIYKGRAAKEDWS